MTRGRRDRSEDAAWRVYVRASQAAGLGPVVDAELASLSVDDPQVRVFWTWWQVRTGNLPVSALAEVASEVPEPGQLALAWVTWTLEGDVGALALLPDDPHEDLVARLEIRLNTELGRDAVAASRARA